MTTTWQKRWPYLVLGVLCLCHCLLYWNHAVDDAYITYRYSRFLSDGFGFVFNPGQRVEGFSTPLWVIVIALVHKLIPMADPHRAVQFLGFLLSWGTVCLLFATGRRLFAEEGTVWPWIPALLFLFRPATAGYAMSGMESPLHLFLLSLSLYFLFSRGLGWRFGLVMGLAALTRPETPYLFGLLGLAGFWLGYREQQAWPWRKAAWSIGLFLALLGSWLLFRRIYFGEWLPNTYYAKQQSFASGFHWGSQYLLRYFRQWFWLPLVGVPLALLSRRRELVLLSLVWLFSWFPILRLGSDWMPQYRFLFHNAAFEVWVLVGALFFLVHRLEDRWKQLSVLVVTLILIGGMINKTRRDAQAVSANGRSIRTVYRQIGQWLRTQKPGSVAVMDVGGIAYFAYPTKILDLAGLTDHFIARRPGALNEKQFDGSYILKQKPGLILLHTHGGRMKVPTHLKVLSVKDRKGKTLTIQVHKGLFVPPHKMFKVERNVYMHPGFHRWYRYERSFLVSGTRRNPGYMQHVYRRRLKPFVYKAPAKKQPAGKQPTPRPKPRKPN